MSRIAIVKNESANPEQLALFDAIQNEIGMVPNFLRVFAHSPDALKAFLGLHHIATNGSLDTTTRESIALSLAQKNECQYCLSAHTAIGRKAGLDTAEIEANRSGTSNNAKTEVAVKFSTALVEHKGAVTNAELQSMRDAGYSEGEIIEVITHAGMNLLTNILGRASQVDVDFPSVPLKQATCCEHSKSRTKGTCAA